MSGTRDASSVQHGWRICRSIYEPMTIAGLGLIEVQQSLYGLFMDQLAWINSWDARFQLS